VKHIFHYCRGWSPRQWLVWLAVAGLAVGTSTAAWASYRVARSFLLAQVRENVLLRVRLGAREIDGVLEQRQTDLATLAAAPTLSSGNLSEIEAFLQSQLSNSSVWRSLAWVAADGSIVATVGVDSIDPSILRQAIDKGIARSDDALIVTVSSDAGSMVGVTDAEKARAALDRLQQYVPNGWTGLLNGDGKLLLGTTDDPEAIEQLRADWVVGSISPVQLPHFKAEVAAQLLTEVGGTVVLAVPLQTLEDRLMPLHRLAVAVAGLLAISLGLVARQVFVAERERERARQADWLNQTNERIRSSLDLDRIVRVTLDEVVSLLALHGAAFAWYDETTATLDVGWVAGRSIDCGRFDRVSDLATQLEQAEPLVLKGIGDSPSVLKLRGYRAVPVRPQADRWGFLIGIAPSRRHWTPEDRVFLESVASSLAVAMTQAHLYRQTQTQVELLDRTLEELKKTQTKLVQTEKMSGLGQLVAGIAHELNNPVNFILGNLPYAREYVEELLELVRLYETAVSPIPPDVREFQEQIELGFIETDLARLLTSMQGGAERIRQVVLSLRSFSRLDEAQKKFVSLHEGIDSTLLLLQHRLEDVKVVKNYAYSPSVECYPGQMNQVFMNLLTNAIDALQEIERPNKQIWIETAVVPNPQRQSVYVKIADNGPGIPSEIRERVFDPFFTTKPVGRGTGMGLAIAYQIIVELHGGTISIESSPLGGTEVLLDIPVRVGQTLSPDRLAALSA